MDPLTNLYDRLRQRAAQTAIQVPAGADRNATARPGLPEEPPLLEDWLRFWNDEDTDLGNLRNFEHWMARVRTNDSKAA
jgi:hypothetical protein